MTEKFRVAVSPELGSEVLFAFGGKNEFISLSLLIRWLGSEKKQTNFAKRPPMPDKVKPGFRYADPKGV
jgi:hypothetical protein